MTNQTITPFNFNNTAVRTFTDDHQNAWFLANDVCDILGYRNARDAVAKNCKEKGVAKRDTLTIKGNQTMLYINEGNLYRLIVKSRKPEAERFEAWLMEEVLPTIRKTGSWGVVPANPYLTPQQQFELRLAVAKRIDMGCDQAFAEIDRQNPGARTQGGDRRLRAEMYVRVWNNVKRHFKVAKYGQILASQFEEALAYVQAHKLSVPALAAPTTAAVPSTQPTMMDLLNALDDGDLIIRFDGRLWRVKSDINCLHTQPHDALVMDDHRGVRVEPSWYLAGNPARKVYAKGASRHAAGHALIGWAAPVGLSA
jgi:prophage antirepressor-like protein